jgi:hypothetical protein
MRFFVSALLFAVFLIPVAPALAARGVPQSVSYQGTLADSGGNPLGGTGTQYHFRFSLWDSPTVGQGSRLWPSSAPAAVPLLVRQGSFSVDIGGAGYPDALDHDFASDSSTYLQVEVSPDGSSFETLSPRSLVTSSPFSQVASRVSGLGQSSFGTTSPLASSILTAQSTSSSAVALTLFGSAGQAASIFDVLSSTGSSLFAVAGGGNVGIGTSTPGEKLWVSGSIGIDGDGSIKFGSRSAQSVVQRIYTDSVDNLYVGVNDSGKSIKVGTATFSSNGMSDWSGFFQPGGGGAAAKVPLTVRGAVSQTADLQRWQDSSGTSLVTITSAGGVGLGTSTPSELLQVHGGKLRVSNSNANAGGNIYANGSTEMRLEAGANLALIANAGGDTSIKQGSTQLVTVKSTGNVGIGTTSPSQMLTVGNNNQFTVTSGGTVASVTGFNSAGSNSWLGFTDGNNYLRKKTYFGSGDSSVLDSSSGAVGIVGIGTTTPNSALSVVGTTTINTRLVLPPSATAGMQLFNVGDNDGLATNERAGLYWSGNTFNIATERSGGTSRPIAISSTDGTLGSGKNVLTVFPRNTTSPTGGYFDLINIGPITASGVHQVRISNPGGSAFTGTAGDNRTLSITPIVNSSGTSANTDLLIERNQITTGSGEQNIIKAGTSTHTGMFVLRNTGLIGLGTSTLASNSFVTLDGSGHPNSIGLNIRDTSSVYNGGQLRITASSTSYTDFFQGNVSGIEGMNLNLVGTNARFNLLFGNSASSYFDVDGWNIRHGGTGNNQITINRTTNQIALRNPFNAPRAVIGANGAVDAPGMVELYGVDNIKTVSINATTTSYVNGGNFGVGTSVFTGGVLPGAGTNKFIVGGNGGTGMVVMDSNNFANFSALGATEGNFTIGDTGATSGSRNWNFNSNDGILSVRRLGDAQTTIVSTPMTILANGNVGIGSTTPNAKLSVKGTGLTTGQAFQITNSSDVPKFTVLDNGGVGIGTTTPAYALDIFDGISSSIRISNSSTPRVGLILQSGSSSYEPALVDWSFNSYDLNVTSGRNNFGTISLNTRAGGSTVSRLFVSNAGNVGIGTTTPTANLHVIGSTGLYVSNSNANANFLRVSQFDNQTYFDARGAGGELNFRSDDNGSVRLHIDAIGNVGIGTTTPTAQLTTTGTVRLAALTGAGSNLIVDALGNVTVSSDERLKDISGPFARGLEDVRKLSPITYHWRPETGYDTASAYTGFSAQNVQSAIPEAVATGASGFLNLADRPIVAALVNAVKELDLKISSLTDGTAELVVRKIKASELCLDDVCITKDQLRDLLNRNGISGSVYVPAPEPTPAPSPAPTPEPVATSTSEIVPEPAATTTEPVPEAPAPIEEPVPEVVPEPEAPAEAPVETPAE